MNAFEAGQMNLDPFQQVSFQPKKEQIFADRLATQAAYLSGKTNTPDYQSYWNSVYDQLSIEGKSDEVDALHAILSEKKENDLTKKTQEVVYSDLPVTEKIRKVRLIQEAKSKGIDLNTEYEKALVERAIAEEVTATGKERQTRIAETWEQRQERKSVSALAREEIQNAIGAAANAKKLADKSIYRDAKETGIVIDAAAITVMPLQNIQLQNLFEDAFGEDFSEWYNLGVGELKNKLHKKWNSLSVEQQKEMIPRFKEAITKHSGVFSDNVAQQIFQELELSDVLTPEEYGTGLRVFDNIAGMLDFVAAGQIARDFKNIFVGAKTAPINSVAKLNRGEAQRQIKATLDEKVSPEVTGKSLEGITSEFVLPKADDVSAQAESPHFQTFSEVLADRPLLAIAIGDEEIKAIQKDMASGVKKLAAVGGVEHIAKSKITRDGEVFTYTSHVGPDDKGGFTTASSLLAAAQRYSNADTKAGTTITYSQVKNGSLVEIPEKEVFAAARAEMAGNKSNLGELYITVTQNKNLDPSDATALFDSDMVGLTGGIANLMPPTSQLSPRIIQSYLAAFGQSLALKQELLSTFKKTSSLSVTKANKLFSIVQKGQANTDDLGRLSPKWFDDDEIRHLAAGDQDVIDSYRELQIAAEKSHRLVDSQLVDQAITDGWNDIAVTIDGERWKNLGKVLSREEAEKLDSITVYDLATKSERKLSKEDIQKAFADSEKLLTVRFAESVGDDTFTYVMVRGDATLEIARPTSVLKKIDGYVPQINEGAYFIKETFKGKHNGVESTRTRTLGSATNSADAKAMAEELRANNPDKVIEILSARETVGPVGRGENIDELYESNRLIYGRRSQNAIVNRYNQTLYRDVMESWVTAFGNISKSMTFDRVAEFWESGWTKAYAQFTNNNTFPKTADDFKKKELVPVDKWAQYDVAKAYWVSLDAQRKTASAVSRAHSRSLMMSFANRLAESWFGPYGGKWVANKMYERAASGKTLADSIKTVAFVNQIILNPQAQLIMQSGQSLGYAGINLRIDAATKVTTQFLKDIDTTLRTGKKVGLAKAVDDAGILQGIDLHDFVAEVVSSPYRRYAKGGVSTAIQMGKVATKKSMLAIEKAGFGLGERMQKSVAWFTSVSNYMVENKKTLESLTKEDFLKIAGQAEAYSLAMSPAGRLPIQNYKWPGVALQYKGVAIKLAARTARALPQISKIEKFADKSITPAMARRQLGVNLLFFGAAGGGSLEAYNRLVGLSGVQEAEDFAKANGLNVEGLASNVHEAITDGLSGLMWEISLASAFGDNDVEFSSRFSPASGGGADFAINLYDYSKALVEIIAGDGNPADAAKFASLSQIKRFQDIGSFYTDLFWNYSEHTDTLEKLQIGLPMLLEATSGWTNARRAWMAYELGGIYDKYGVERIGGVTKAEAISKAFGIELSEEDDRRRVIKSLNKQFGMSDDEVKKEAKKRFDDYKIFMSRLNDKHPEGSQSKEEAIKERALYQTTQRLIAELSYPSNQRVAIQQEFARLVIGDLKEKGWESTLSMFRKSMKGMDRKEVLKALKDIEEDVGQADLIKYIESAEEMSFAEDKYLEAKK